MLKRAAIGTALTVAFLFAVNLATSSLIPCAVNEVVQSGGHKQEHNQSADDNCTLSDGVIAQGLSLIGGAFPTSAEGWTAVSTLVIAFFTIVRALVGREQANLTGASVRIAERSLMDLEVPFIALKIIESGMTVRLTITQKPTVTGFPTRLKYCFANYGRTPASLTEIKIDLKTASSGALPNAVAPSEAGEPYPTGVMVAPNGETAPFYKLFSDYFSTAAEISAIVSGTQDLFVIGFLKSTDIFKTKYTYGFCLKFDRKGDGFAPQGG